MRQVKTSKTYLFCHPYINYSYFDSTSNTDLATSPLQCFKEQNVVAIRNNKIVIKNLSPSENLILNFVCFADGTTT